VPELAVLYQLGLAVHVVTAVLGLGQVTGLGVIASSAPTGPVVPATRTALRRLALGTTLAIALMMLSGVLIEYASGASFHETLWFRIGFFLLIALGALSGRTQRVLRKLESGNDGGSLRAVARMAWAMCAIVTIATILMELKPW
jgi:hypothetical protein